MVTWATQYKIDSFRFDLMSFHPRAVIEQLRARVDAATGRRVFMLGEGWNFGAVGNDARFVQASQRSLNGSGLGTFSDRARDFLRGGGPFGGGQSLVQNQGAGAVRRRRPPAGARGPLRPRDRRIHRAAAHRGGGRGRRR
jgi:pullulanase